MSAFVGALKSADIQKADFLLIFWAFLDGLFYLLYDLRNFLLTFGVLYSCQTPFLYVLQKILRKDFVGFLLYCQYF